MEIKDQFVAGNYTILLFDELEMVNGKYVEIEGKHYEAVICFDLPNAIAIKAEGDFKGKKLKFIKEECYNDAFSNMVL